MVPIGRRVNVKDINVSLMFTVLMFENLPQSLPSSLSDAMV